MIWGGQRLEAAAELNGSGLRWMSSWDPEAGDKLKHRRRLSPQRVNGQEGRGEGGSDL